MAEVTKLLDRSKATELRSRHPGKTIVFTNGCFDILHAGLNRIRIILVVSVIIRRAVRAYHTSTRVRGSGE